MFLKRRVTSIRCENRPVFQAKNVPSIRTKTFTYLPDVTDAIQACVNITSIQDKVDYFESVGLDYYNTVFYYDTVVKLNKQYDKCIITHQKSWLDNVLTKFEFMHKKQIKTDTDKKTYFEQKNFNYKDVKEYHITVENTMKNNTNPNKLIITYSKCFPIILRISSGNNKDCS